MAEDIGGVWRTIGGRRVFIKDGDDLETAMKKSGKFKKTKTANKKDNKKENKEPSIEEIKQLQKELTEAKRNETKLEHDYLRKSGAEIGFDHEASTEERYQEVREARNEAYHKYKQAQEKRQEIEKKLERIRAARNKEFEGEDMPLF